MVNFGIVKTQVSQMLGEHFLNNQHKSAENIYREYMTTVRNSPVLMLEYIVFKNLERKGLLRESACKYVDDNVALFKSYTRKEIIQENEKLAKFHQNVHVSWEDKILFENIQTLILETAGGSKIPNINKLHDSLSFVMESVMAKNQEEVEEDSTELLEGFEFDDVYRASVRLFNEKYSHLSEAERNIVFVLSEGDETKQRVYFDGIKEKARTYIKESTSDIELRLQGLQYVESKLFNTETLMEDILDLHELLN